MKLIVWKDWLNLTNDRAVIDLLATVVLAGQSNSINTKTNELKKEVLI